MKMMYLMQTYHDYLVHTGQDIHSTKKVRLPKPELYMIYIGEKKKVPECISFAEAYFGGQGRFFLPAHRFSGKFLCAGMRIKQRDLSSLHK